MVACNEKTANVWVARIIPVVLVALVIYTTWVVVGPICGRSLPEAPGE
jgi:hypothetical protein